MAVVTVKSHGISLGRRIYWVGTQLEATAVEQALLRMDPAVETEPVDLYLNLEARIPVTDLLGLSGDDLLRAIARELRRGTEAIIRSE